MLNHSTNTKEQHITNGYQTHEYFTQRYLHFRPIEQPNRVPEYKPITPVQIYLKPTQLKDNNTYLLQDHTNYRITNTDSSNKI